MIIDTRPALLAHIKSRLSVETSFPIAMRLRQDAHRLERELQPSFEELNRVARGWVFIPPLRASV